MAEARRREVVAGGELLPNTGEAHPRLRGLLAEVEARLREVWERGEGFLSEAARMVVGGRGKRLRPTVVLLAAECGGGATESSVALAAAVEVVHTASLVHDDVVDGADSRRGEWSAQAVWGSRISVLLGDYLLANALELLPREGREGYVAELLTVAKRMCAGQVEELRRAGSRLTEAEYLAVLREKTGSLFGFCGRAGAEAGGGSEATTGALGRFGDRFGVAFQMADDILDLVGTDGRAGKPEGRDLAEGKFTLPVILAAEQGGDGMWEELERMLGPGDGRVERARELVAATGAVEAAWGRVEDWLALAREELAGVPEGAAKQALVSMTEERFPMPVMR